jgi:pentatricopeptide repeat protein
LFAALNAFGVAKLFQGAEYIIREMEQSITPDTTGYNTLLKAYVENEKFLEAFFVFSEMNSVGCVVDMTLSIS